MLHAALEVLCLVPSVGGSIYGLLCAAAALAFRRRIVPTAAALPPITVLKPIHGLEKNQEENLRAACRLDYPDYQLVLSAQRLNEPALPLMRAIADEFGPDRVTVAAAEASGPAVNGKVLNLQIAMSAARHDVLVISDSDVRLRPDYLRAIVAPLADPQVGYVCTLYRAVCADRWYEKLELLSLNADFTANLIFASVTGASDFCLGSSVAFRRRDLDAIDGLAPLGAHLNEDFEMGRRLRALGRRAVTLPYFVDTMVDLNSFRQWWGHQLYWDQNTCTSRPVGFFATVLTRSIPFALLFATLRGFDPVGLSVLTGVVAIRLATTAFVLHFALRDREGLKAIWLLPFRDLVGLVSWFLALTRRDFVWRGNRYRRTRDGRIVPRPAA
jgi:ceramide glucosyltransferase